MEVLQRTHYSKRITYLSIKYKVGDFVIHVVDSQHSFESTYNKSQPNFINYLSTIDIRQNICIRAMPYYPLGDFEHYSWNPDNFHQFKNILTQTVFALLYAYESNNLVYQNVHPGNIMIQKTDEKAMTYGAHRLELDGGLMAVLMDMDGKRGDVCSVYWTIDRLLSLATITKGSDLGLEIKRDAITPWVLNNTPVTLSIYDGFKEIIDQCHIRYVIK